MTEKTAPQRKKSRPVMRGILTILLAIVLIVAFFQQCRPAEKKPDYITSADPVIQQKIGTVESLIAENAQKQHDPDTTVMALFSMESALKQAENFEQLTGYILQEHPERVAPEIQLLKYRFFNVYKKFLSNRISEEKANSVYRTTRDAVLELISVIEPATLSTNRIQAQRIWEKYQAQDKLESEFRKKTDENQTEIVDLLFSYMTLSSRYLHEWEKLCALRDRAYLAAWNGSPDEVIANASAAVKLAPDEKEAHILLIMALLERNAENDRGMAESLLEEFLKKHPDNASGFLLRGISKIRAGHADEAATDFAQAAVYYPKQQQELADKLGIYRKRAYLNHSMEGRIIVNAYRAMMSGSGYFSPDFQTARLMLRNGRISEARKKIFDHFFRRRMQGEWDKVLDDFRFSSRFLNTDLFQIGNAPDTSAKIAIEPAFFTNSVILKLTNAGTTPLHNVTVLLCVRFTDMFKNDYISFPVGETIAVLPPGKTIETGRSSISETTENILGTRKKFKDIIEFAAVLISDENISWIGPEKAAEAQPDPPEHKEPFSSEKAKTAADVMTEKTKEVVRDAISHTIDKAAEKLTEPAVKKP